MEILRKLLNKSKLLTDNSNFTLQITSIDSAELKPLIDDANLLARNIDISEFSADTMIKSDGTGSAYSFFQFIIGPGLPKNYGPLGITLNNKRIRLIHNGTFAGPNSDIWKLISPTLDKTKHELGYWVPSPFYKLLSELQERKIHLEFPALIDKSNESVYGAIPNLGKLKAHLLEKRII